MNLQPPSPVVAAATQSLVTVIKILNVIILVLGLLGLIFGTYADASTWISRIVHLIIPVVGIVGAHYRHKVLLRVFAAIAGIGVAIISTFIIITVAAFGAFVHNARVPEAAPFILIFVISSGLIAIFDIANLILSLKLISAIDAAESGANLYSMVPVEQQAHPQPAMPMQTMPYAYTQQPQQAYAMQPMMTIPAGATMVPMMGTVAAPQQQMPMGVYYTQPYAIPPTLTQ